MSRYLMIVLFCALILMFLGGAAEAQPLLQSGPTPRPTCGGPDVACADPPMEAAQQAQSNGSIRGTVYEDRNRDGKCAGTGDPWLAGVPIKFVSGDGQTTVYLQSGENGSYGLVAAGLGTWRVTAEPAAPMAVTSLKTVEVFLSETQSLAVGVDFCVARTAGQAVLPAAGAPVAPVVVAAGVAGLGLFALGLGLERRRRRTGA